MFAAMVKTMALLASTSEILCQAELEKVLSQQLDGAPVTVVSTTAYQNGGATRGLGQNPDGRTYSVRYYFDQDAKHTEYTSVMSFDAPTCAIDQSL